MKPVEIVALLLLGNTSTATPVSAVAPVAAVHRMADTGSPEQFAPALAHAVQQFDALAKGKRAANAEQPARIPLVFHVLSGSASEGDLSDALLATQLAVLNDAYRPQGFQFALAEVRRYPDSPYFAGGCFPTTETGLRMKAELAVDPSRFLNIYTCKLALPFIAGYGTLPNEYPEDDSRHGVVIDYGTLPGGAPPLDRGHTLVHEIGHYLGLLHTFQGGCVAPGDSVDDTPFESGAGFGCQVGRDSCPQEGPDPVSNYMSYSEDRCTDRFTRLQGERMQALVAAFRPHLIDPRFAIGAGITGQWYHPDQGGHGFSIEVLPGNRMLAAWFVFAPDGGPTWIYATGPIKGDTAVLQAVQAVGSGGRFPPHFDAGQVLNQVWGTLSFTFTDCYSGEASWQPVVAGYTSGSLSLTRLTMPAGLSCP